MRYSYNINHGDAHMASQRYADMLQQGFMKPAKAKKAVKKVDRMAQAKAISDEIGLVVLPSVNNRFEVQTEAGYSNYLTLSEIKKVYR